MRNRSDDAREVQSANAMTLEFPERVSLTHQLLLQGKWKFQILCILCAGPVRLGQLARLVPAASKKMLTQNLRKLEADGIVRRTDLSDVVLHVEYDLNPVLRDSIADILNHLAKWSDEYIRCSMGKAAAEKSADFLKTLPIQATNLSSCACRGKSVRP